MYCIGIDCGTQGTKAIVFDSDSGDILSKGYARHNIIADEHGKREQDPQWWIDAMVTAVRQAIHESGVEGTSIRALAVSGQQHGLVLLDKEGNVLRNAKLWNDTSTICENEDIIQELGGMPEVWNLLGTTLPVGYTASKVRAVAMKEPDVYREVRHILLPHDYINYWLTGEFATEGSEASGTGYYDVRERTYSTQMMDLIDPSGILKHSVPLVKSWNEPLGVVRSDVARLFGVSPDTLVACGGGDNTMSAVGTASIIPGRCSLGLGTSGTVSILSQTPGSDIFPLLQLFDVFDEYWLVTACTLNATSATTTIQRLFDLSVREFDEAMAAAPVGSGGICAIPFFDGERMPSLPSANGIFKHLTSLNCSRENLIRAVAESVICTLKWGFDKILDSFSPPSELIITGGGSNSAPWRQIVADLFDMPVYRIKTDEGGAFGAALQATYLYNLMNGASDVALPELCNRYVPIDTSRNIFPNKHNVEKYQNVFNLFKQELATEWGIEM